MGADPFGYLKTPKNVAPAPPHVMQSALFGGPGSWGPGQSTLFAAPGVAPVPLSMLGRAQPIYPHAYVTFGAGMRQKEVDMFTAKHPLEATSSLGPNEGIPYHVPL